VVAVLWFFLLFGCWCVVLVVGVGTEDMSKCDFTFLIKIISS
jgi:hypothetical protein